MIQPRRGDFIPAQVAKNAQADRCPIRSSIVEESFMHTQRRIRIRPAFPAMLLVLAALGAGTASAGELDFSLDTLKGVRTMAVRVDGVDPEYRRYGVDAERLQAAIEARLRSAGVEVVPLAQARSAPDGSLLEVAFRVHHHAHDYLHYYPYAVSLKLKQKLALASSAESFVAATVWSDGRTGVEQPIHLQRLNGYVLGLLEQLIADLQAQNS